MEVDLSRAELEEAVRVFVYSKTGVRVAGKKVVFLVDRITEEVSGASVKLSEEDSLPLLGRHTA